MEYPINQDEEEIINDDEDDLQPTDIQNKEANKNIQIRDYPG